ncbi:MAG TPA: DJ-1/PfpI family protein [Dokdonella sp.]|uniref:DJ-1/PfpI family protein n=1 Tax=Dokdonella sp. TaxID=2291710 RepID=UPI002CF7812B|nr:DJ-1/PfpI family protein [Dokdonella sp.]HUD43032.1 DJ-1/PfpI family protein [Dokdonella sp.]
MRRSSRAAGPLALLTGLFALTLTTATALAAHEPRTEPTVRVGIVLFDGVQIIDFAAPYEVFGAAGFGVATVSANGKPVTTAMGLRVTPDHAFADAPAFDVLVVPGGDVAQAERDTAVLDFIRRKAAPARHVLTVCTGAAILAATGLLDGQRATTYFPRLHELAERYPKVQVIDDVRWTDNGKLITSAGLSSGMDAALHVVDRLRGEDVARTVALRLEYDWRPGGGFVRSRMADRHLVRQWDKKIAWPADMAATELTSFGDEHRWRKRYRIVTATSPEALLGLIADGIAAVGGWTRDGEAWRWHRDGDGRPVTLTAATSAETAGRFDLELSIDAP